MKSSSQSHQLLKEKRNISWLVRLMFSEIWALFKLNVLFLLTCIPIVTIGPAWGALSHTTIQILRGRSSQPVREYSQALRDGLKACFAAECIGGAIFALLAIAFVFYSKASQQQPLFYLLLLIVAVLFVEALLTVAYAFPLLTCTDLSFKNALRDAVMLTLACPFHSIPAVAVAVFLIGTFFIFLPFSLPLGICLAFSVSNMIISYATWIDIKKFIIKEAKPEE